MKHITLLLILVASMVVLFFCCSTRPLAGGGSGTETVGGILVDTLGKPVENALVLVTPVDTASSIEFWDATNKEGRYLIENISAGIYSLESYSQDSSLYILIDSIIYTDDSVGYDRGVDTMRTPGSISGKVHCDNFPEAGVVVYIPGTSFDARSDDSGHFRISFVPEGVYNLYYEYPGFIRGIDTNVTVISGLNTLLDQKNLSIDPNYQLPAPGYLFALYDTAYGIAKLSWEAVTVSDILGYHIYRKDSTNSTFNKIATAYTATYSDTIFENRSDTNSYFYQYQVTAIDTLTNESNFSPRADLTAASPTLVMTQLTWTHIPSDADTVLSGQQINLAVTFKNRSRKNILIRWYTGSPRKAVRTIDVDTKEGNDTLSHTFNDTGAHLVFVEAFDERGDTWRDSCIVSVHGLVSTDTWEHFYNMVHPRRFCGAAVINSNLFAIGGAEDLFINMRWTPAALGSIESFSDGDNSWSSFTTMPTARYAATTSVVGKKLYIIGGMSNTQEYQTIEIYDYQLKSWETPATMPAPRFNHAACVFNDSIYVFGGITKSGGNYKVSDSIHVFDPTTKSWSFKRIMNSARANHQAVIADSTIYIIGGQSSFASQPMATMEKFNPIDNSIVSAKEMSSNRMYFGAAFVQGKIYAIGGYVSTNLSDFTSEVEAYDPISNNWITRTPLPQPRHNMAVCIYNNSIYVLGGSTSYYNDHLGETRSVLRYFP